MRILEVTFHGHPDASKSVGRFGVHDSFTFEKSVISTEDDWMLFSLIDGREVLLNKGYVMSMIYYDERTEGATEDKE